MSNQVSTAFIQQYRQGYAMLVQQRTSKLRACVREETIAGKKTSFDQIGAVRMQRRNGRAVNVNIVDTPHKRRWVSAVDYDLGDYIDDFDKLNVLQDPTNAYTQAFSAAGKREIDYIIAQAALGTAYTGEEGTTAVVLPAAQKIAVGGTGFTLAKLQQAVEKLKTANALDEGDEINIAWTAKQELEFINTTEVKSSDFSRVKVMDEGGVERFYRVNFHLFEDFRNPDGTTVSMLPKSGTTRSLPLWVKSGVVLGLKKDVYGSVDWIAEKKSYLVAAGLSAGAVRMEEEKVVQIDVVES